MTQVDDSQQRLPVMTHWGPFFVLGTVVID